MDFDRIFSEVCLGNKDAFEFCAIFLRWVHLIDDCVDADKPIGDLESVTRLHLDAFLVFAFNPFWQAHKKSLLPLVIQGTKAFLDSIEWAERPDFRDRASADVIKAQYQEVFWHVAMICGGYDHIDRVTRLFRHYHYDVTG